MRAQSLTLFGMAAIFAAMLGRAGFIDWVAVGSVGADCFGIVLAALLVVAVLIGVPTASLLGLISFIDWATTPRRKHPPAPHLHPGPQPSAPPTR